MWSTPTLLFGYDAKTDNESDFHCEELTIENKEIIYDKSCQFPPQKKIGEEIQLLQEEKS